MKIAISIETDGRQLSVANDLVSLASEIAALEPADVPARGKTLTVRGISCTVRKVIG